MQWTGSDRRGLLKALRPDLLGATARDFATSRCVIILRQEATEQG